MDLVRSCISPCPTLSEVYRFACADSPNLSSTSLEHAYGLGIQAVLELVIHDAPALQDDAAPKHNCCQRPRKKSRGETLSQFCLRLRIASVVVC
jgi:hypothetical protein